MSRPAAKTDSKPDAKPDSTHVIPESRQCRFTTAHGKRCSNPVISSTLGLCIVHERHARKLDGAEAHAISEELLGGCANLKTLEDVNSVMFKLLLLVSQRRISRSDGALLAYIGSLLLQTIVTDRSEPPPPTIIWDSFSGLGSKNVPEEVQP